MRGGGLCFGETKRVPRARVLGDIAGERCDPIIKRHAAHAVISTRDCTRSRCTRGLSTSGCTPSCQRRVHTSMPVPRTHVRHAGIRDASTGLGLAGA
eukprot:1638302-Rhodomonas_salina.2